MSYKHEAALRLGGFHNRMSYKQEAALRLGGFHNRMSYKQEAALRLADFITGSPTNRKPRCGWVDMQIIPYLCNQYVKV